MIKLKYIISILLLFAIHQVFAVQSNENSVSVIEDYKIELSIEADNSYPGLFVDVPGGRDVFYAFFTDTNCDPGFSKSKKVSSELFFSVIKCNLKSGIDKVDGNLCM